MFTGLVEERGRVAGRDGSRLRIAAELVVEDAKIGDSVAVNGCCLTVVDVRPGDRLGGHIVQGHVDAVGEVVTPAPDLYVRTDPALLRYVVEKGSIAVDGISLTVVEDRADGFTVAVIPHTAEVTTLGARRPGDRVNLEVDLMAKYAEKLLDAQRRRS